MGLGKISNLVISQKSMEHLKGGLCIKKKMLLNKHLVESAV